MGKMSAGVLAYRKQTNNIEVLIVHPGGPFRAKKDKGAWSIPKGEFESGEPLDAAKREFQEEVGLDAPTGNYQDLGSVKNKSSKTVYVWAIEADLDVSKAKSNTFMIEWPPKSGKQQEFPEVDKVGWFSLEVATQKLNSYQVPFIERLADMLGANIEQPEQTTLL